MNRRQLLKCRAAIDFVSRRARAALMIRKANREKRVTIFQRWIDERKAFTRTILVDECHVWLDPVSSRVVVPRYDKHGHRILKPKKLVSVS